MSTILVAAIVLAFTIIPPVLFVRFTKRKSAKRREKVFALLKNHGNDHGLSFTHEQMLKGKMLGLDLHHNKLLILDTEGEPQSKAFDLADFRSCTLFREYDAVRVYDPKAAKTEQVLARVGLKLETAGQAPVTVQFFNSRKNGIYEISDLEKKAAEWKELLSQKTSPANRLKRA